MMPLAPVRLSITSGCFNRAVNSWPAARMMTSVTLPAAIGTITRIGLAGYAGSAHSEGAANNQQAMAGRKRPKTRKLIIPDQKVPDDRRAGGRTASDICDRTL